MHNVLENIRFMVGIGSAAAIIGAAFTFGVVVVCKWMKWPSAVIHVTVNNNIHECEE